MCQDHTSGEQVRGQIKWEKDWNMDRWPNELRDDEDERDDSNNDEIDE